MLPTFYKQGINNTLRFKLTSRITANQTDLPANKLKKKLN